MAKITIFDQSPLLFKNGSLPCSIIAGGLIQEKAEVEYLQKEGVLAVSTSNAELWNDWK